MRIMHIVGARPNFMKVAPIVEEMKRAEGAFDQILVHTGQHYDDSMSQVFFEDLGLPRPDVFLDVGSGSHAQQTARIMSAFEPVLLEYNPDWVIVVGDVNSTVACALTAAKLRFRVAHVEAGLRSFDRSMPEEINRIVTDHISDLLFTTEQSGNWNLSQEGISAEKVSFVGNTMIDTLVSLLPRARASGTALREQLGLARHVLVTLHRPSNVDDPSTLRELLVGLNDIASDIPVLFPVHPRTKMQIDGLEFTDLKDDLLLMPPMGYLAFLGMMESATLVITDSGGVQEETTYLGVPCLTVRSNTERPITLKMGTNQLVQSNRIALLHAAREILQERQRYPNLVPPPLWDGAAARRIVDGLRNKVSMSPNEMFIEKQ